MIVLDMAYTFSFKFLTKINTSATHEIKSTSYRYEVDFIRFLAH